MTGRGAGANADGVAVKRPAANDDGKLTLFLYQQTRGPLMDWCDLCLKYHEKTAASAWSLDSLPQVWQRELAALWRIEADTNNGGYLQFVCNWGMSNHADSSAALQRIGAFQMQAIIDSAYLIVSKYVVEEYPDWEKLHNLLPEDDYGRIMDLSYEFMDYPDDIEALGIAVYGPLEGE